MNQTQRKYLSKLRLHALMLLSFLVIIYFIPQNIFDPVHMMFVAAFLSATVREVASGNGELKSFEEGSKTINDQVKKYPVLLLWYFICMICAVVFMLYVSNTGFNIIDDLTMGQAVIAILALISPVYLPKVIIEEYEKFNSL